MDDAPTRVDPQWQPRLERCQHGCGLIPFPPLDQCGWDAQRPRPLGAGMIRKERQAAVEMPLRPAVLCTATVDPEDAAWVEAASLSAAEP